MLTITKAIAHSYYTKQYARSQENITEKKKKNYIFSDQH